MRLHLLLPIVFKSDDLTFDFTFHLFDALTLLKKNSLFREELVFYWKLLLRNAKNKFYFGKEGKPVRVNVMILGMFNEPQTYQVVKNLHVSSVHNSW